MRWSLGIQVKKMKNQFNAGDTWRWLQKSSLIIMIYNYMISLIRLVTKHVIIKKIFHLREDFFIITCFATSNEQVKSYNYKSLLSVMISEANTKCLQR